MSEKNEFVEVSAEEWERLRPEERRARKINIVRMPDGLRFPVYDFKSLLRSAADVDTLFVEQATERGQG